MPLDGTTNPVNEILFGAISYLETYGWCQRKAIDGEKRCIWGALRQMSPDGYSNGMLFGQAQRAVCEANNIVELGAWNDAPGRRKEEVLDALARASDICARHQQ